MKSIEYESHKANFPEFVSCITFAEESWADPGAEIEDLSYINGADMKATQKKYSGRAVTLSGLYILD